MLYFTEYKKSRSKRNRQSITKQLGCPNLKIFQFELFLEMHSLQTWPAVVEISECWWCKYFSFDTGLKHTWSVVVCIKGFRQTQPIVVSDVVGPAVLVALAATAGQDLIVDVSEDGTPKL